MKKRIFSFLMILTLAITLAPAAMAGGTSFAARIGTTEYATLKDAVLAAADGATIEVGEGNYSLYEWNSTMGLPNMNGIHLTFVGQGADKTKWRIGSETPTPQYEGTEYNNDYCFRGSDTITFRNMTLQCGDTPYKGFSYIKNIICEDCTIGGELSYWGTESATFDRCIFNAPTTLKYGFLTVGDYSVWGYEAPVSTYRNCTFNSCGKVINVYSDQGASRDTIINFENNTINDTALIPNKCVLNIKDNEGGLGNYKYIVNISGTNTVNGMYPDQRTCTKLFQVSAPKGSHHLIVNVDGETVWANGEMQTHSYTYGEKENNFKVEYGEWDADDTRLVTYTCNYCRYKKTAIESRSVVEIEPKPVASYAGGTTEHGGTMPSLRFKLQLKKEDGTVAPITSISGWSFTLKDNAGNSIKLSPKDVSGEHGSVYLFPTLEKGLELNPNGTDNLTGDYLKYVHVESGSNPEGHYTMALVNENDWSITAEKDGIQYKANVTPDNARVVLRSVSNNADTIADPDELAASEIVSAESKVETVVQGNRQVVAVIPQSAQFYTNGSSSGLGIAGLDGGNQPKIVLMYDEILPSTSGGANEIAVIKSEAAKAGENLDNWNYRLRYLDLVNENDGNAWMSCNMPITVYWPYPEEILAKIDAGTPWNQVVANYDFQILHFAGMDREYWDGVNCTVEKVNAVPTEKGLRFVLPADKEGGNMSPFAMMWKSAPAAAPTPTTDPSIDVPKTGDNSHTGMWCVTLLIACAAIIALGAWRKNKVK